MAKKVSPPKSTGVGGITFADKVSALFMAHMLRDESPFDVGGRIERIDYEARPEGWLLDDLVLTLRDDTPRRVALSVKSNTQFTDTTAPTDFVEAAWEQYLGEVSSIYDSNTDLMGLVTTPLHPDMRQAVEFVLSTAREGAPKLLPGRYQETGWANNTKRALFKSFACPKALAEKHGLSENDTGRVLARLRCMQFDFEASPSESEKQAVERCRAALRSGDQKEARKLWEHLLRLSSEKRSIAGTLNLSGLIDAVRSDYELSEVPSYYEDWRRLTHLAESGLTQVKDSIGGQVRLEREAEVEKLNNALTKSGGVVLLGPSGSGKSVIAKEMALNAVSKGDVCLWFEATSFEQHDYASFQANLGLAHPLREVLRSARGGRPLLVLDGFDRLYNNSAFSLLVALFDVLELGREGAPWRVVMLCQTQEWHRLQHSLLAVGAPVATWSMVECEPMDLEALGPVWEAFPAAARLRHQANLHPLISNLKILDLIASHLAGGGQVDTATWVGESSVASWCWHSQVVTGADRRARERFTMLLAEYQADELELTLPLDHFDVAELGPLDRLEADRVCMRTDSGRVGFSHDLFGDWARLHILIAHADDISHFLNERMESPVWHRAIRLYGAYLLEHASDVAQWQALVVGFASEGGEGACDLLLESIVFAANPTALLHQVRGDLQQESGQLLRRLLRRFLAFATLPNPVYQALAQAEGNETANIATRYRYPNWTYWPPVLQFLHECRADMLELAPAEFAKIAEMWLVHTNSGFPMRREVAELALLLGQRTRHNRLAYGRANHEHRKLCYQIALMAAVETPDEVAAFALQACERLDDDDVTGPVPGGRPSPRGAQFGLHNDLDEPDSEPWPDGPRRRVDGDFQDAVLETAALLPLMRVRPSIAREVLLASLIKARVHHDRSYSSRLLAQELDIDSGRRWHPPLYSDGPFLGLLLVNYEEGVEIIARLVDFASERWRHNTRQEAHEHQGEETALGDDESPTDCMASEGQRPLGVVTMLSEAGDRDLIGDAHVFGWSAGLGCPPSAIESALMALEQYLYLELDQGRPVDEKVQLILNRMRSAAFLKPLCDLGKRQPDLFKGPLRSLLAIPEVYEWDIQATVAGRQHMMIGAMMRGVTFAQLAKKFHDMEHRSTDLRNLGVELFLKDEGLQTYLSEVRQRWERRLSTTATGPVREFLEQLIIYYDITNYKSVEHPEHGLVIVNVRAQELYEKNVDARQKNEEESLTLFLPMRCRQMLDERTVLQGDELEEFWEQVQRIERSSRENDTINGNGDLHGITERPSDGGSGFRNLLRSIPTRLMALLGRTPHKNRGGGRAAAQPESAPQIYDEALARQVNALTGVAAVLVRNHAGWLAQHPDRKEWCRELLRTTIMNPPPRDEIDLPESIVDWTWDCFASEALPTLWADDVSDEDLRRLVARLLSAPHFSAVQILFARCAEQRGVLGEDFKRLRRLVFELAHIRNRVSFIQGGGYHHEDITEDVVSQFEEAVEEWAQDCIAGFVDASLPLPTEDWKAMDRPGQFTIVDAVRAKRFGRYYLDFRFVRVAHEWLPAIDEALNEDERQEWLAFLRSALTFSLSRVGEDRDRDSHPYEDDNWVLDRVAAALPLMRPDEGPDQLWRTVLGLRRKAHDWVEDFLQSFHRRALHQDPVPGGFSPIRLAIIEYALTLEHDGEAQGWSIYEDVWLALIGIDWLTQSSWEARHQALAAASEELLERWTDRPSVYGRHLSSLATWLETDAAALLRLRGLSWLDRALKKDGKDRVYRSEDSDEAIASLLQVVWRDDEARLRRDAEAFVAFRSLLSRLASRQIPLALELVGRLGGLAG